MVYSYYLSTGAEQGPGLRHRHIGFMGFFCRTFHTVPEQGQGPIPIVPHCSGSGSGPCPGPGHSQRDYTIQH